MIALDECGWRPDGTYCVYVPDHPWPHSNPHIKWGHAAVQDTKMMNDEMNGLTLTGDAEIDAFIGECLAERRRKAADYSGPVDLLKEFRDTAKELGITMPQAWGVHFRKHLAALMRYVRDGKVESEPIRSRAKDLSIYLWLFVKMINEIEGATK